MARHVKKITYIYATAVDHDKTVASTKRFYASSQNKMHYAIHGHTAAKLIVERYVRAERKAEKLTATEGIILINFCQRRKSIKRTMVVFLLLKKEKGWRHDVNPRQTGTEKAMAQDENLVPLLLSCLEICYSN